VTREHFLSNVTSLLRAKLSLAILSVVAQKLPLAFIFVIISLLDFANT